jgi:hypothetical protein
MPRVLVEVGQLLELLQRAYDALLDLSPLAHPRSMAPERLERAAGHLSKAIGEISLVMRQLEEIESNDDPGD